MKILKECFPYILVEINGKQIYIDHPDSTINIKRD